MVAKILDDEGLNATILSLHDQTSDKDDRYTGQNRFMGFAGRRLKFIYTAFKNGLKCDAIILSHINLLRVANAIHFFSPNTRIILIAHGIEVWPPLLKTPAKKALKNCHQIVAVSRFTKDQMVKAGIHSDKITVIPNALDPYLAAPSETPNREEMRSRYGLQPNDFELLTLTRLSFSEQKKGYDRVFEAMSGLKEKFPQLKYVLAGKCDKKEQQRIRQLVEQYGLHGQVVLTGFVKDEELAAHYQMADGYIMPSEKEGFGITFIEAAYYGLPVIAGNKDGSSEALLDGRLGQLINPKNVSEIQKSIENLMLNKEKYLPSPELIQEHFSYAAYQRKWKPILND